MRKKGRQTRLKKVLFVDCCVSGEKSRTRSLADFFIGKLEKTGRYEIDRLHLAKERLTYLSEEGLVERNILLAENRLNHPSFRYARQFAAADKIIITAPFWDLSFPALLKIYIENICVRGITFHANETGLQGLCKADRMLYLTTRGGIYTDSDMEQGARYLEQIAMFFGIRDYICIAAEGMDMGLSAPETILEQAKLRAAELSEKF